MGSGSGTGRKGAYHMADGSDSGLVPATETKTHRGAREDYDSDLEWLLIDGDAAMGARGTLGGVIAQLEHGGPFTGVPNTDLYSDQQIGWSAKVGGAGLVEKHRWLSGAWSTLEAGVRRRLAKRYQAPPAEYRSDEGFGARDVCPSAEDIEHNRAIEPQLPTAFHHRRGTEARLGQYAALAFELCDDPAALQRACHDPNKGKSPGIIRKALELAKKISTADHGLWRAAKAAACSPRSRRERVALLPQHDPHGAEE